MSVYATADKIGKSESRYLTAGRKYRVIGDDGLSFSIINDFGRESVCLWQNCSHLRGGAWRKIESIEKPEAVDESTDALRDDAPALLDALILAERTLCAQEDALREMSCGEINAEPAILTARALIAKHRGES